MVVGPVRGGTALLDLMPVFIRGLAAATRDLEAVEVAKQYKQNWFISLNIFSKIYPSNLDTKHLKTPCNYEVSSLSVQIMFLVSLNQGKKVSIYECISKSSRQKKVSMHQCIRKSGRKTISMKDPFTERNACSKHGLRCVFEKC